MNKYLNKTVSLLSLLTAIYSTAASAQWQLNASDSVLNIVASKKVHTSEVFVIKRLSGELSDSGALSISLDLSSINTGIGIRDERMQEHLFEVEKYPSAIITTQLEASVIDQLKKGGFMQTSLTASLDLHGLKKDITMDLNVMSVANKLLVSARKPLLINSEMFGLSGGLAKLGELAGGISISQTAAVNFSLVFDH
jgi:polyisoprenoid-binding protein YceI